MADGLTHVIDGHAVADRHGRVRAICGRWTDDHAYRMPTCPDCAWLTDEDNALLATLVAERDKEWGDGRD